MDYFEVRFYNDPSMNEILMAFLGESSFDMFEEREGGLNAYIPANLFNPDLIQTLISQIPGYEYIRYEAERILDQNWNKKWESNFEAVLIADSVYIRAPFHAPLASAGFDILIEPKMSFGTGHHATTALMVEQLLRMRVAGKTVVDMGCGTSLLAILASKMGASEVHAVDIDDWCIENSKENILRNHVEQIHVHKGDAHWLSEKAFDIILANINRNVLIDDMPKYANALHKTGTLVLSGFLKEDKDRVHDAATSAGLKPEDEQIRNNWMVLRYHKY